VKVILGIMAGASVAIWITVGLQLAIWGGSAPSWFAAPVMLIGCVCGALGAWIGLRWKETA